MIVSCLHTEVDQSLMGDRLELVTCRQVAQLPGKECCQEWPLITAWCDILKANPVSNLMVD